MSKEYSLTQVLGIWLIFASAVPVIFSTPALMFFRGIPFELTSHSTLDFFVLISPFILIIHGWGLYKNIPAARIGLICYLLLAVIVSFVNYLISGVFITGASTTLIIVLLGVLILSDTRITMNRKSDQLQT
jgi:hypothetical protein